MTALQCSALIDETSKEDFVEEIKEEYEEVRDEHYDSLKVRNIHLCPINCCFFATLKFTQRQKLVCLLWVRSFARVT